MIIALGFSQEKSFSPSNKIFPDRLAKDFIKVLPSKGVLIDKDSLLLGYSIYDVIDKIDTLNTHYQLVIDKPISLSMHYQGGNYSVSYFVNYSAVVYVDSFEFHFFHSRPNEFDDLPFDSVKSDMKLVKISVRNMKNIGLNADLAIGCTESDIYKYYSKPRIESNLQANTWSWIENGIIFTLGLSSKNKETCNRIVGIEINNRSKH